MRVRRVVAITPRPLRNFAERITDDFFGLFALDFAFVLNGKGDLVPRVLRSRKTGVVFAPFVCSFPFPLQKATDAKVAKFLRGIIHIVITELPLPATAANAHAFTAQYALLFVSAFGFLLCGLFRRSLLRSFLAARGSAKIEAVFILPLILLLAGAAEYSSVFATLALAAAFAAGAQDAFGAQDGAQHSNQRRITIF